ncbi:MAG: type II secretion system protein [Candidatus Firestonebacteria bacterium]
MRFLTNKKGFILLDALIGVGLLGIVIVSCLHVFSEVIYRLEEMEKETVAITLAQNKMEELSILDKYEDNNHGDFSPNYPDFTWASESKLLKGSHFYKLIDVQLTVYWKIKSEQRSLVLQNHFLLR